MSKTLDITNFTVLYIDDNHGNVRLLTRRLNNLGAECVVSTNPRKCIDLIREHKPDVILLDLHMPGLSGFEVLEQIRTRNDFDAIPVWAFSANSDTESRMKCREVGFDGFIAKPLMRDDVQMLVSNFTNYKKPALANAVCY